MDKKDFQLREQIAHTNYKVGEFIAKNDEKVNPNFDPQDYYEIRKHYRAAANIHRKVREYIRTKIVPGADAFTAVEDCEGYLRDLCHADSASSINKSNFGQAFPMGLSANNIAAHYSPLKNDTFTITNKDMLKVDFGVHNDGYLIDSAFTIWWDHSLDVIAEASKESTNAGLKAAGVDVRLSDIGKEIEEVMKSYEFNGKPLHPVYELCGHGVGQYLVHTDDTIPQYDDPDESGIMKSGLQYACETYATETEGELIEQYPASHYMLNEEADKKQVKLTDKQQHLFYFLKTHFSTLAWCPRWLDTLGYENYDKDLQQLIRKEIVDEYPQYVVKSKCHIAQFEHTFMPSDWGTEIFSRGDDY